MQQVIDDNARHVGVRDDRPLAASSIRILHLIETGGPGGAERMLLSMASHLEPQCRSMVGLVRSGWLQSQVMASGIPCAMLAGSRLGDFGVFVRLLRLTREQRIDLIHAHEFYMNVMGSAISFLTGIPLVMTIHGKSYYPEKSRRRMLYQWAARNAAAVVAVSHDLLRFFETTVGLLPDRAQVIFNGIQLRGITSVRDRGERCRELGIPATSTIIGSVGNLYSVKGHIHLIRAARTIIERRPDTHVVILGRGELRDSLLQEAKSLGIQDRIHLVGYRDDTPQWLQIMDVFVLPSLSEGLPLSLLEAMAAGIPSVATKVGGIPEVVDDGVTGFLVPPEDSVALADKVLRLLDHPTHARQIGEAGRCRIEKAFSLDGMVDQYREVYRTILKR